MLKSLLLQEVEVVVAQEVEVEVESLILQPILFLANLIQLQMELVAPA